MPEDKHRKRHLHPQDETAGPGPDAAATPGVPPEEYEALKAGLAALQAKADEYFDGWTRERADFMNYKKRIERDQVSQRDTLTASVIKKYLVILDDLERALRSRPAGGDGAAWAGGVELICRKLQGILEAEGIQRIAAENQMFDPAFHEAILQEENPVFESGQITEVIQHGYTLGDRIIRPAQVKVAR